MTDRVPLRAGPASRVVPQRADRAWRRGAFLCRYFDLILCGEHVNRDARPAKGDQGELKRDTPDVSGIFATGAASVFWKRAPRAPSHAPIARCLRISERISRT